ncbi:DUF2332 family protein [Micromonospora sp. DT81.3]|uniref:DUF2332 family protein n=1 Tax=Micromonospora sp. DT81.3 TaxID=3416523 RepID=UPI003CF136FA
MNDPLASQYEEFGRRWAHDTSPLYEQWSLGIAGDSEVLTLLRSLPAEKQQPNLIFASARWAGGPLAGYPEWRDWLVQNWDAVADVARARTTQTNEAGRCATWMPPLSRIDGPVALLEVGAAAGLCLFPDRYGYEYTTPSGIRRLEPAESTSVTLPCRIDDADAVPARYPEVVWRRGIDLAPIDASDPAQIDWLATLIWPGPVHDERVARLRAAARIASADPPRIARGDLLELVSDVAAESPADATLVVFHSAVLLYLDSRQRRRFAELMSGLGAAVRRRVMWLSNETKGTLDEIDAQVPAGLDTSHRFVQTRDATAIALAGQHGAVYETAPFRA